MNLFGLLSEIEKVEPEAAEKLAFSRRKLLKTTSAAAAAAIPTFFASTVNKAFGDTATVVDVLNFALTLEYLERDFYRGAQFAMTNVLPGMARRYVIQVTKHEAQHVDLLKGALGSAAVSEPMFDFTAGGAFPDVFSNYATFLAVAQSLEDTGVRAYKGQAPRLMNDKDVLTIALRIHSVEARHAAAVRRMQGLRVWASEGNNGSGAKAVYMDEDQQIQAGVNLVAVSAPYMFQKDLKLASQFAAEAFDEPLTKEQVLAIAGPFIKSM